MLSWTENVNHSANRNKSNFSHSQPYLSNHKNVSRSKHSVKSKQRESLDIGGVVVAIFALGGGIGSAIIMSQM